LTSRSIYIVVIRADQPDFSNAQYWINTIKGMKNEGKKKYREAK
jgi:hypothetical protein